MTDRTDTPDAERPLPSAGAVVEAFGGIRPMAAKLDIPVTTVQGWKERDRIPKRRWAEIRQAAADQGFDLDALPDADAAGAAIAMPPPGSGAATPAADAGKGTETEKTSETEKTGAVRQDDGPWAASAPEDEIADGSSATDAPASDASGPTAAPDRPPAAAAPRPARRRRSVWPWLVAAFVVAGLAVTWRIWWPMVEEEAGLAGIFQTEPGTGDDAASSSPPAPESRAAAPDSTAPAASSAQGSAASPVEAEIAALKESVRALQAGGGDGGAAQKIAALEKQVQALSGTLDTRVATLEGGDATKATESALAELRTENARLGEQIEALRKTVQGMEQRFAAAQKRAGNEEVTMLAVGQLRAALMRGAPFQQQLKAIESLSAEDEAMAEAIATLWPHAYTGVETEAELRARFDPLASEVLSAEQAAAGDWSGRILAKLNDIVTVRRVGGAVEGDGADAVLARAEARLKVDDLPGAVEAMGALKGAAAAAASPWVADARARVAADKALAALENRALAARTADEG